MRLQTYYIIKIVPLQIDDAVFLRVRQFLYIMASIKKVKPASDPTRWKPSAVWWVMQRTL